MSEDRVDVRKTTKLFIGGAFPRSESGRTQPVTDRDGTHLAHASLASRKDLRDAVAAARKAQPGWAGRTAYNRGQILYRIAELLEDRRPQFEQQVAQAALPAAAPTLDPASEVSATIDRWVHYAGWTDKLAHVLGTRNPVAGPYFNISAPEPVGVVGVVAPDAPPLLGLTTVLAPVLAAGNTAVAVTSETAPLVAITLAEVLATSDVPGGVVNVLTGRRDELLPWLAGHRDVDAIDATGVSSELRADVETEAADNLKRVVRPHGDVAGWSADDWLGARAEHPYACGAFLEIKTVWHPAGR